VKCVVLDSSALLTLFHNRPGAAKVEELIQLAVGRKRELLLCVVNWGEIFYAVWRDQGPGHAHPTVSRQDRYRYRRLDWKAPT